MYPRTIIVTDWVGGGQRRSQVSLAAGGGGLTEFQGGGYTSIPIPIKCQGRQHRGAEPPPPPPVATGLGGGGFQSLSPVHIYLNLGSKSPNGQRLLGSLQLVSCHS